MPSNYNKYLEYLGHVDDTTRDDILAREAQIRQEVEAHKKRLEEDFQDKKAQCESEVAKAKSEVEREKNKAKQSLSQLELELTATIKEIETNGKLKVSALEEQIKSLNEEHERLITETEIRHQQEITKLNEQIKNLKAKANKERKIYAKAEEDLKSHYESQIAELEYSLNSKGFFNRIRKAISSIFKKKGEQEPMLPSNDLKRGFKDWMIYKQDYKENKWGTLGYALSLFSIVLLFIPVYGIIICIIPFLTSIIGLCKTPNSKAKKGIILSVISIAIAIIWSYICIVNLW